MLKLLKYELIHSWRTFGLVYMAFLMVCLVIPFTNPMYSNNVLTNFLLFALIFLTIGISISVFVSIAVTFNRTMFKRPGYLTLTLPVSTHQLILSKLLANLLWILISGLVLFCGMVMMVLLLGITAGGLTISWNDLLEFFGLFQYLNWNDWYELIIVFVFMIASCVMTLLLIYLAITAVQTKFITRFKTGFSLIFYFLANYIFSFATQTIKNLFLSGVQYSFMNDLYVALVVTVLFAVGYYFVTVYIINHKLEVE